MPLFKRTELAAFLDELADPGRMKQVYLIFGERFLCRQMAAEAVAALLPGKGRDPSSSSTLMATMRTRSTPSTSSRHIASSGDAGSSGLTIPDCFSQKILPKTSGRKRSKLTRTKKKRPQAAICSRCWRCCLRMPPPFKSFMSSPPANGRIFLVLPGRTIPVGLRK